MPGEQALTGNGLSLTAPFPRSAAELHCRMRPKEAKVNARGSGLYSCHEAHATSLPKVQTEEERGETVWKVPPLFSQLYATESPNSSHAFLLPPPFSVF